MCMWSTYEGLGLIWRHEGVTGSNLMQHPVCNDLIELVVTGIIPIVDKGTEHSTTLPPVVRLRQIALDLAGFVAMIVFYQTFGSDFGSSFYRIYRMIWNRGVNMCTKFTRLILDRGDGKGEDGPGYLCR